MNGPDQRASNREQKHPLEWAIAIMLFFTLLATSTAAYYTRQQWLTAADQEQRSLRAYVGIGKGLSAINDPKSKEIVLEIENYGQTPAKDVKMFSTWANFPPQTGIPGDFGFSDVPKKCQDSTTEVLPLLNPQGSGGAGILYPHAPINSVVQQPIACPAEAQEILRAISEKATIILYGHINYLDVFGEERTTTFCVTWATGGSGLCDRHNEIDPPKGRR